MKFQGFIGPAYSLSSSNVDAQRCVNMYPVKIESGTGKGGQQYYLKATPGLLELCTAGDGPLRLMHVDSIGRILVVSGNKLMRLSKSDEWTMSINSKSYNRYVSDAVANFGSNSATANTGTDILTVASQAYTVANYIWLTGMRCTFSNSGGSLPTGISAATNYFIIALSATTIRVATTQANASAGTYIDITGAGSGTNTLTTADPDPFEVNLTTAINYTTNVITKASHGFYTGCPVDITTQGFPLPSGLAVSTTYYVIVNDANTFQLASSLANAVAGTAIDLVFPTGTWQAVQLYIDEYYPSEGLAVLLTSTGSVASASMSYGGDGTDSSTLFCDGSYNYIFYDLNGLHLFFQMDDPPAALGGLTFPTGPTSSKVVWSDGYFILAEDGTNTFWVSGLKDFVIDALSYASSEGSPDILVGLTVVNRVLYLFNEQTIEIYVNTGAVDFPFERTQGGFVEIGCCAPLSIATVNSIIFWLGQGKEGRGLVYLMNGTTPTKVSNHAIEYAISTYADIASATAFGYQSNGHFFYVLNFDEATWVYDMTTGSWHQRAFTNSGALERHLAELYAFDPRTGTHIVTDVSTNEIYQFSDTTYSDDGSAITRLRSSPHVSSDQKRLFCSSFQLDMEVGIGLDGGVQGSSPTVMFDFSDDGGHTWSSESWALADNAAGSIGEYKTRVRWTRLGSFRDRIFRVKMTDPVKTVWIDAQLDVIAGES